MKTNLPNFGRSLLLLVLSICSCTDHIPDESGRTYSNDVAVAWTNLQQKFHKNTPGFNPGAAARAFAYVGLTMYESIVPGLPEYQSLVHQIAPNVMLPNPDAGKSYYWPASLNASMKAMFTGFFTGGSITPAISAANLVSIDSLQALFSTQFANAAGIDELARSSDFGTMVGTQLFQWSKSDGTFNVNPPYVLPVGPGLWVPTPPAFAPPATPYGGTLRSFTPNLLSQISVPAPIAYSEDPASEFYKINQFLYDKSLVLTAEEISIAKTWGDIPGNYNGPSHFTNVVTQLVVKEKLDLAETALLYAKNGIAMYDAAIQIFKTKYELNGVRPITYIRNVLGHPTWNTVIPTPPHPEFPSAHSVIMQASAEVLKARFGEVYAFSDHTHDPLFGTRSYASFDEYAREGARSRSLAGVHYQTTAELSLLVGKQVGGLVNNLKFKK